MGSGRSQSDGLPLNSIFETVEKRGVLKLVGLLGCQGVIICKLIYQGKRF